MDSAYLKENVGPALTAAMTAMIVEQPKDSVEFVGNYLLAYVEREQGKKEVAEKFAKADAVAKAAAEAKEVAAAEAVAAAEEAAKPLPDQVELATELASTTEVAELFPRLMELIKAGSGASSVYLGVKDAEAGTETATISFVAGTAGSDMEGKVLMGAAPDAEEPVDEGVSFGVFKALEPVEGEEEEAAEEEEGGEPKPPKGPEYPTEFVVKNVVREPAVKFYGIPKLGSYVALPVRYDSCLHADGVEIVPPAEPAEDAPPAEEGAPPPAPTTKPKMVSKEVLVGMHTMGQSGRTFSAEQLAFAKEWTGKLSEALGRAELALWEEEVGKTDAKVASDEETKALFADLKQQEESKLQEAIDSLGEAATDDEKAYKTLEFKFQSATAALQQIKEKVVEIKTYRMVPKPEPVRILQTMLYSLDIAQDTFIEPATKKVNWEKMRKIFDVELMENKLAYYDPADESIDYPKYARVEALKELLGEITAETAAETMPPLYVAILEWVLKAIELREAAVAKREKEAEAEAAAEE
eukprot:CAMPEP_0119498968 /NCGR_PEP_ID=MMETSP1344-20130328/21568_1 /TAXON_ID=236787 /ORGANISM="Florenciella parvula, Strain CCMP2471" /LENGTH=525 /DNA_ID=CAMNT_0007534913 /DNA_START=48 /DNA_END=1625 /DNA_ORIENTATION=-